MERLKYCKGELAKNNSGYLIRCPIEKCQFAGPITDALNPKSPQNFDRIVTRCESLRRPLTIGEKIGSVLIVAVAVTYVLVIDPRGPLHQRIMPLLTQGR
jgi:hypothetical protein